MRATDNEFAEEINSNWTVERDAVMRANGKSFCSIRYSPVAQ